MKLIDLKKAALVTGIFIGVSVAAQAQGAYAKLGAGYNFGTGATTETQVTGNNIERVKLAYGKGVTGNAALGYMFNPNVGAELGFGYLAGGKTNTKSVFGNRVENDTYYSRMFLLQPALVISAGREGINLYGKFGLIAAKGKLVHELEYNQNGVWEETIEQKGNWGLGLQAALGMEFSLTNQVDFFTELSMNNLNYAPEKAEIVKYSYNGNDQLHLLTVRDRGTVYVDKYQEGGKGSGNPKEQLKDNRSLNSIGLNLGVKYKF